MAENKEINQEKKEEHKHTHTEGHEHSHEHVHESPKTEEKKETKTESKPSAPKVKKTEAIAHGSALPISKKHSMYISRFIKNKTIDQAIADLQRVLSMKIPVPYKGEIPHRHGNMMSGRYPINASKHFINLLKGLKGNAIVNGMDLDKTFIKISSASWASRPLRGGGVKAKRTNIILIAKEEGAKHG